MNKEPDFDLRAVDQLLAETTALSMAVKVQRLLESAAPAYTGYNDVTLIRDIGNQVLVDDPEWRSRLAQEDEHECDGEECTDRSVSDLWLREAHPGDEHTCLSALCKTTTWNREAQDHQLELGIHLPTPLTSNAPGHCPCWEDDCPQAAAAHVRALADLTPAQREPELSSPTCSCGCGAQGGDGP